jgi:hypothetical protein
MILPIPLMIAISFVVLFWMIWQDRPITTQTLVTPVLIIHAGSTFACLGVALAIVFAASHPVTFTTPVEQSRRIGVGKEGWYSCPHCKGPGIPVWRKACLDPIYATTCRICGGWVGVPYLKSLLAALPLLGAVFIPMIYYLFAGDLEHTPATVLIRALAAWLVAMAAALVCSLFISLRVVPLVPR